MGDIGQFPYHTPVARAAPHINNSYICSWYHIRSGDTLSAIAEIVSVDIWTLAQVNRIIRINLIFAGQQLCIPHSSNKHHAKHKHHARQRAGIEANGNVRWYAYDALDQSNFYQARTLLLRAATYYGLPASLLLAIAWQESNWRQHVISHDGGIGIMQIMPYTALWINTITGLHRDPYKLRDNIFMGAFYVRTLCDAFHWDLQSVISAYNEGPWAVTHNGIKNWHYVNNVLHMTHSLN